MIWMSFHAPRACAGRRGEKRWEAFRWSHHNHRKQGDKIANSSWYWSILCGVPTKFGSSVSLVQIFHDQHLLWSPGLIYLSSCKNIYFATQSRDGHHPSISFPWSKHWMMVQLAMSTNAIVTMRPPSSPLIHTQFSTTVTIVSNDPTWRSIINAYRLDSYFSSSWRAVGRWS